MKQRPINDTSMVSQTIKHHINLVDYIVVSKNIVGILVNDVVSKFNKTEQTHYIDIVTFLANLLAFVQY